MEVSRAAKHPSEQSVIERNRALEEAGLRERYVRIADQMRPFVYGCITLVTLAGVALIATVALLIAR